MLSLKLGLSVNTTKQALWQPTSVVALQAWYRKASGITESSGAVSEWSDQSSNSINMEQSVAGEKPTFANAVVTFEV